MGENGNLKLDVINNGVQFQQFQLKAAGPEYCHMKRVQYFRSG